MKQKNYAKPVFDRRKKVATTGKGDVEIFIRISEECKKYVKIAEATPLEYENMLTKSTFKSELEHYDSIAIAMIAFDEPLTMEHLNERLGFVKTPKCEKIANDSFLDWMYEEITKLKLESSTIATHLTTWKVLNEYGKLSRFKDLTSVNLNYFNDYLDDGTRKETTRHNYHKILGRYCRRAYERGLIAENPYMKCHFSRGRYADRQPLTEDEIVRIRDGKFYGAVQKAADLFVFSCYTGLAYADIQKFDYEQMTVVKEDGLTYIDGNRVKTDSNYYTPILPPAMKILKKYHYQLPKITNQKYNYYLKIVQEACGITKKLTTHLARHSFATLMLAHGCMIENLAKMLGHKDIRTTQIYGKILKQTIENQIANIYKTLL